MLFPCRMPRGHHPPLPAPRPLRWVIPVFLPPDAQKSARRASRRSGCRALSRLPANTAHTYLLSIFGRGLFTGARSVRSGTECLSGKCSPRRRRGRRGREKGDSSRASILSTKAPSPQDTNPATFVSSSLGGFVLECRLDLPDETPRRERTFPFLSVYSRSFPADRCASSAPRRLVFRTGSGHLRRPRTLPANRWQESRRHGGNLCREALRGSSKYACNAPGRASWLKRVFFV